ncbi:hypothetical protein [Lutibacter sp.]|uniref:hypothetical protein n=1 Tax=Lutibacter sp. TaxID=1925666 RepID=UPI00349FF497
MNKIHYRHINEADCGQLNVDFDNLTYIQSDVTCKKCQKNILHDLKLEIEDAKDEFNRVKENFAISNKFIESKDDGGEE